jgi:predicted glycoside hydrolase/deacetylase ChbG (UPF0249 family)
MMPRVVFVADDLGISPGVDEGIAAAAQNGLVRETSLCVTGASAEHGVNLAKAAGLGIGLHFSLTLGRALSGPIPGFTDAQGRFRELGPALRASLLRRVDRAAVGREVEAQLQRLRELGVCPTHFNGHHHVHCWPGVREVCFAAAAAAGIRWTRLPAELAVVGGRLLPRRLALAALARGARRHVTQSGLRALPFVGSTTEYRVDFASRFAAVVARLPLQDCEWMVHPRFADAEFARLDPQSRRSEPAAAAELAALTAPSTREVLAARGFLVSAYTAVDESPGNTASRPHTAV